MFDQILSIIAPHRCYECGKTGYILCQSCKKYIIKQRFQLCILCGNLLKMGNLCDNHQQPYNMLWCFGCRRGSIAKIIDDYKFRRVQAAAGVLGDLLDSALPELPADAVIVPIPTTSRNMRRRGYFTTGSTLAAAADCLRQAGAENVQAAVIARHGNI